MFLACLGIILGIILLTYGADRFVSGAANIADTLGVSPMVIGLTIVGLATSMPEVLVGTVAALDGKSHIAIGNAIGSNITNSSLVLGATALILPITIASKTIRHEYALMLLACAIAFVLMIDNHLSQTDGLLMCLGLIFVGYWIVRIASQARITDPYTQEILEEIPEHYSFGKAIFLFAFGLILLLSGAKILVDSSIVIAKAFGLSDLVIGLTIIAIGTSLPELAASVVSALKNEADIAVGNVIGSNIFNMLIVLGVPIIISPTGFDSIVLLRDFSYMTGLAFLLGLMMFLLNPGKFTRINGLILLTLFFIYQFILFKDGVVV